MRPICVAIPEILYEQLEALAQEKNLKISETVRLLLREGLENNMSGRSKESNSHCLQKQTINYAIMAYCLIESAMQHLVEGTALSEQAHAKAQKIIKNLLLTKASENFST